MLAIIPARGGSKGLPNKNIKRLLGKPLIAYSIEAALSSKYIKRVIVSTDSREIADIAMEYGAEVPFLRPDNLASDIALAVDNYIYTINKLEEVNGIVIKDFIVLQPTSPLRTTDDIDKAIDLFREKNADSIISYTEESHPIYWHKKISKNLEFIDIFENKLDNRQAFEKTFYPNGAVFIFKTALIRQRKYYSKKSFVYLMDRLNSVDIDTIEDFEYAQFLLRKHG